MGDNCLHAWRNDGAVRPPDARHGARKRPIHWVGTRAQDACNTFGETPPIPQKADAIRGKAGSRL